MDLFENNKLYDSYEGGFDILRDDAHETRNPSAQLDTANASGLSIQQIKLHNAVSDSIHTTGAPPPPYNDLSSYGTPDDTPDYSGFSGPSQEASQNVPNTPTSSVPSALPYEDCPWYKALTMAMDRTVPVAKSMPYTCANPPCLAIQHKPMEQQIPPVSSNCMAQSMPCTDSTVMPQPKLSTPQNEPANHMPYQPWTVIQQSKVSTSRNHTENDMAYNPWTVMSQQNISAPRNQMHNQMPYNPWTVMSQPEECTPRNQTENHMAYNPWTVMQQQKVCNPRNQTDNQMPHNPVNVMPQPEVFPGTSFNMPYNPMLFNPGTMVPQRMRPNFSTLVNNGDLKKPADSYFQLIADALLSSEQGMLMVGDICKSVMNKHPYYKNSSTLAWKGGIRHNLSVNDCFHMVRASNTGRGNLWTIHKSCVEHFKRGNYNRRAVNQIAQQSYNQQNSNNTAPNEPSSSQMTTGEPSAAANGNNPASPTTTAAASLQQENAPATQP